MDIDAIAWHRLTDVHGSAEEVSARLRAFLAGDGRAEEELIARLYHQCDVTDATAAAILVLGGELARGGPRPADCLNLLALFARAALSFGASDHDTAERALERVLAADIVKGRVGSLNASTPADSVWGALRRVVPRFGPLFEHSDALVVERVAQLAAVLAGEASVLASAVRSAVQRVDASEHPTTAAALLSALARTADDPDDSDLLAILTRALTSEVPGVRAAAAFGLLDLRGAAVGPEVVETLVSCAVADATPRWLPDKDEGDVAVQLGAHAGAYSLGIARRSDDFVQAVRCAGMALEQVWEPPVPFVTAYGRRGDGRWHVVHGGPRHPTRAALTRAQAEILDVLTEVETLWSGETDLFERLGLPPSRDALRTFTQRALAQSA